MLAHVESPDLFGVEVSRNSVVFRHDEYKDAMPLALGIPFPAVVKRAVLMRRAEYVAGRVCARQAVRALLGSFDGQIGSYPYGAPLWPPGLVGSITHTREFASAAVARASVLRGIGLDTERIVSEDVMGEISAIICSDAERLPPCSGLSRMAYTTLIFSAKESVFKCLHPLVGQLFRFDQSRIEITDVTRGLFRAELTTDLGQAFRDITMLQGRFSVAPPYVHTGVMLAV